MTLYLFDFNNYYNRIIKKFDNLYEYGEPLGAFEKVNFNPNNGINTEIIINYEGDTPNYVIIANEENEIVSRWFIIEHQRTRAGQYRIVLYRDVVADWYDDVINTPVFIEKAIARIGDTAIFNNENMSYNQIKTSETLLKDKSKIPWIVGYIDRKYEGGSISIPARDGLVSAEYTDIMSYPYYKYTTQPLYSSYNITNEIFRYNFYNDGITGGAYVVGVGKNGEPAQPYLDIQTSAVTAYYYWVKESGQKTGFKVPYFITSGSYVMGEASKEMKNNFKKVNWSSYNYRSASFTNIETITMNTIMAEDGKIIKAGDNYYRIAVVQQPNTYLKANIPTGSALANAMRSVLDGNTNIDLTSNSVEPLYEFEVEIIPYSIQLIPTTIASYTVEIPSPTNRAHLDDAPYDMFMIPYGEIGLMSGLTSDYLGMRLASEIQVTAGKQLYDLQLLPYCPISDTCFDETTTFSILREDKTPGLTYNILRESGTVRSVVIWLKESKITKYIDHKINISENNIEFKVQNECDLYRLSSPNYNSAFDFSATKNGGVFKFRVDLAYKPVSPYIRIAPFFNNLYGNITDDARGLICGGDFSLSSIEEQWLEYRRNNKNFQEIFDRQIENMEVNNNIIRLQEKVNVATGMVSAGAMGGVIGGNFGGQLGSAVGAIAGAGVSLAGGLADIRFNEKLRAEALDYTKDQFGYQLGNIAAMPTLLTKVSSFNPNNKIFPVLEYYTCTDIEKEALRNKIKYNGMTIMRIGTIQEFLQTDVSYIKCQLIRLMDGLGDFQIFNTLSNELNKGVFI